MTSTPIDYLLAHPGLLRAILATQCLLVCILMILWATALLQAQEAEEELKSRIANYLEREESYERDQRLAFMERAQLRAQIVKLLRDLEERAL